jgi:serine/threonine-protein kinase HipA
MDRLVYVYIERPEGPVPVGRLWSRVRKGRESATFEYDRGWLRRGDRFALEPALTLTAGPFPSAEKCLFGAIGDSAPDRWGRALMRRAERRRAERERTNPRTLFEVDFLLQVDDEARQGALRFALAEGGPFLAQGPNRIPPLVELPRLLAATQRILRDEDDDDDLRLVIAPGSSLGGARPKASVRDGAGHLAIAKFPHPSDDFNVVLWEAFALALARSAGIAVPRHTVKTVARKPVIIVSRFDRDRRQRIPFLSAMSMLGALDNEPRSYLEIADALQRYGAAPRQDLAELWRRIVFNVLISNTDDHLRNHGFLFAGGSGWRLSPAYDLHPVPVDVKPRILSTAIDLDDATASMELALSVAEHFGLKVRAARSIARRIGAALSGWPEVAKGLGLPRREIDRMASAFEHQDLRGVLPAPRRAAPKRPREKRPSAGRRLTR